MNKSTGPVSELQMASYEVGVLMRQKYVANLKPLFPRIVEVLINIALRVHHGNSRAGISNEV
jgi:hypothetical protein